VKRIGARHDLRACQRRPCAGRVKRARDTADVGSSPPSKTAYASSARKGMGTLKVGRTVGAGTCVVQRMVQS
jgi:hypothetical protein